MIVVTVELWKQGNPNDRTLLGRGTIANEGGSATRGSYLARFTGQSGRPVGELVTIQDFPRKRLLAWDLLYRSLRAAIGHRNPSGLLRSVQIDAMLSQLRHAYQNLIHPEQSPDTWCETRRTLFAEGLIAPVIRQLEEMQHGGDHGAREADPAHGLHP